MTIRVHKSTDASAPVLSGTVAALNALLQACLVDGFGANIALGWTRPYYDAPSNVAVFLQGGASPAYLQIDDNGSGAALGKEARAAGYESMTAYNVGTDRFPLTFSTANAYTIRKSNALDASPRNWTLIGDDRRFLLAIENGDAASTSSIFWFGDLKSYKAADAYHRYITGRGVENSALMTSTQEQFIALNTLLYPQNNGHIMRSWSGATKSAQCGKFTDATKIRQYYYHSAGTIGLPYPDPVGNALWFQRLWINEAQDIRGEVPGVWIPLHARPLGNGDTFSSVPELPGRSFQAINTADTGQIFIETSNTWDI